MDGSMQQASSPNVTRYVLDALHAEGITHIFFVPGKLIDPFWFRCDPSKITPIIAAQEGGAAYMADGYARATQNFGVAMGIGGPGVGNMTTAVASAYSDRSPVLIVAGTIPFRAEGRGAFQDSSTTGIDDLKLFSALTVFADVITDKSLLERFIRKAVKAMKGLENRPALLSIPHDMHEDEWKASYTPVKRDDVPRILDVEAVKAVPGILKDVTRLAILAGNGAVWSRASDELKAFAQQYSIPVVTTLRAKGAISEDDEIAMGVFGAGGSLWANQVVLGTGVDPRAEVLLVLGATLNENNTHGWAPMLKPSKALIRVDIDPNNTFGEEYDEHFVTGDVRTFLRWLRENRDQYHAELMSTKSERENWLSGIRRTPYYDTEADRVSNETPINPARAIADLRKATPRDAVTIVDSGAHTFFTGHNWTSFAPNEFLFQSNTGPMGYGIAMAIGAWMARPKRPHVAIVGDGSLLMHGMEIQTAVRFKVPLVVVVINNGALGSIHLRARKEGPEIASIVEISPPKDWASFCVALGGDGIVVEESGDLEIAFQKAFRTVDKPFLVDVRCDKSIRTPNTQPMRP